MEADVKRNSASLCRFSESDDGTLYFFNSKTGQSTWEHPSDQKYRKMVIDERRKTAEKKTGTMAKTIANLGGPAPVQRPIGRLEPIGAASVAKLEPIKRPVGHLAPIQKATDQSPTVKKAFDISPASTSGSDRPKTSHGTRSVPVDVSFSHV